MPPATAEMLSTLWTQRHPAGEIALRLSLTEPEVRLWAKALGLPRRRGHLVAPNVGPYELDDPTLLLIHQRKMRADAARLAAFKEET